MHKISCLDYVVVSQNNFTHKRHFAFRHRPIVPDDFLHLAKHLDDNEHVLPAVHLLHSPITFVRMSTEKS